jgi:Type II secretion system (T2SS), protein M subtype b
MNLRQSLNTNALIDQSRDLFRSLRLSLFETAFLAAALLFVAIVAFLYFTKVQPLNSQVTRLQDRERLLRLQLDKINIDERKRLEQAANAGKILESLSVFESYLKPDERGTTQIINEIDSLGKRYQVVLGEASFRRLEADATTDENGNPVSQAAIKRGDVQIYPVLGIDTTVTGEYPNLRRFISDLERSKQFLIINSLQFQGEDRVRRSTPQVAAGGSPSRGQQAGSSAPGTIPVTLKIEFDTYFQKPSIRGQ